MLRPVSAGGYGEVWLARNVLTGTYRAIKIIWREAFETEKPYEREFEAVRHFEPISRTHPGFVHVLQTGRLSNGFYYIMELADDLNGTDDIDAAKYQPATLAVLKKDLSLDSAIRIGIALTECLEVLHRKGLIHRDIKPSNVIFVRGEPKLADIGLVTEASEANSIVGTNGFIAPEGPTTPRADIYGLGKLLYEIGTGRDRLDFPQLPAEVTTDQSVLLEFNQVLLKACDPDPAKRHTSVEAVRDELEFLVQGRSVRRVRQLEKALRWTKAWLVAACVVGIVGYLLLQSREARRTAASQILERRIATAIAQGNLQVKNGDYLAAISDFGQAALLDPKNLKEHRLRLGSALAYAPKIIHIFAGDSNSPACYSVDSNIFANVLNDRVRLTDVGSKRNLREFDRGATFLAMDAASHTLAICKTNLVSIIDLASSAEQSFVLPAPIWHVSMADNGSFAVTTEAGTAFLFPGNHPIPAETNDIYRAVLSRSGNLLCVVRNDGAFTTFATLDFAEQFHGKHETRAYNATFSSDERTLITCSFDRTAVAWDVETGQRIGFPMEHEGGVVWTAISPDEGHIATGSLDRTVKLWNNPGGRGSRQNYILYHDEVIVWVAFVSDNRVLVHCGDGSCRLWSIDWKPQFHIEESRTFDLPEKTHFRGPNTKLDSSEKAVAGFVCGVPFEVKLPDIVSAVTVDPAEQLVAIGTTDRSQTQRPHSVWFFSRSGQQIGKSLFHKDGITYLTFSHSGRLLLSCCEDFAARIWDLQGNVIGPLRHQDQVRWSCFSDNDEWVATASCDNTVRIWNTASGVAVSAPLNVGNIVDYVTFRGERELFIANSRRNYTLYLPYFEGDIAALLRSTPGPSESDTF